MKSSFFSLGKQKIHFFSAFSAKAIKTCLFSAFSACQTPCHMCYFLLESFHQNKIFLLEFRSQSTFSLATCIFLFNRCSCHVIKRFSCHAITSMLFNRCSSSRHPYHSQPHPLYCFLQMLYYLLAHFLTVVLLHSPEETRLSLYHNYILASIKMSQLKELSRSPQPSRPFILSSPSSLYILVL